MNEHLSAPLKWEEGREYRRGKVLSGAELAALAEKGIRWGRYKDVDGDGVCYRTLPGTDPEQGAYFTRGTSHNEYSGYTEESGEYVKNMQRLSLKWETAKKMVPTAEVLEGAPGKAGVLYYGTSMPAVLEALDLLAFANGSERLAAMRLLAFPFGEEVEAFLREHRQIYVIEQNRDAQMRQLLIAECGVDPARLIPLTLYDGMPLASQDVFRALQKALSTHDGRRGKENNNGGERI